MSYRGFGELGRILCETGVADVSTASQIDPVLQARIELYVADLAPALGLLKPAVWAVAYRFALISLNN